MKIIFVPGTKEIEDYAMAPQSAKKIIPEWYKSIKSGKDIRNIKRCMPFLDSMSSGYMQTTWCDINVTEEEDPNVSFRDERGVQVNGLKVVFDSKIPILGSREISDVPIDESFYKTEFLWQRPWTTILPDGYSALIVHPLNRVDLPFITISAIIDHDKTIPAPIGNMPFYIKKGFTGTIPAGTPMFQIIPFKREDWNSENQLYSDAFWQKKLNERKVAANLLGGVADIYKKMVWQKKSYE